MVRRVALFLAALAHTRAAPIMVDPIKGQAQKLTLFVPGGLVPPEDYLPMIVEAQQKAEMSFSAAIITCHINLCDAISEVNGLLNSAIQQANEKWGKFAPDDIFVLGHSLGGVGARHYFDHYAPNTVNAGLALFGTQTNGDHEDYLGTLGYPRDLAAFPAPLLALTGELDFVPISHTADLTAQARSFSQEDRLRKASIVIPGMDHSQFCSPFEVSGDLKPEISNDAATEAIGEVLAAWLDYVASASSHAGSVLQEYIDNSDALFEPYITAAEEDKTWCQTAQKIMSEKVSAEAQNRMQVSTTQTYSSSDLEHCHPTITTEGNTVSIGVCNYLFYSYDNSTIPNYLPTYHGPQDISCKMMSEDKIATELGLSIPDMKSDEVKTACMEVNERVMMRAKEIVSATWPQAVRRFGEQAKTITYQVDSQSFMGPQWVLTGMQFKESDSEIKVRSAALISSVNSAVFPGSHYCKLLAPTKAVEIVMTTALTQKFTSTTDVLV